MKTTTSLLAVALLAAAGIPIYAKQPPADPTQPAAPAAATPASPQSTQQPATEPEAPAANPNSASPSSATPSATPQEQPSTPAQSQSGAAATAPQTSADATSAAMAPAADLKPVSGELVSKLDTKTAKTGDDVVIETKSSVKTADGTEIPEGSKLMGHIVAVQPSGADSANSQVAVSIDKAELKGGQTVPIHSEIQSVGSTETASAGGSGASAMDRPSGSAVSAGNASSDPGSTSAGSGAGSSSASSGASPGYAPGYTPGTTASNGPAPGTIVARNGHIAIRTTSMPGILLANNAPGEQDPRMTQASGILLGAKKDVQLESGTKVVVGVAAASGASSTGASGASSSAAATPGSTQ